MPAFRPTFNLGFLNTKCSYPSATFGVALNKVDRVQVKFDVALYKTGG